MYADLNKEMEFLRRQIVITFAVEADTKQILVQNQNEKYRTHARFAASQSGYIAILSHFHILSNHTRHWRHEEDDTPTQ